MMISLQNIVEDFAQSLKEADEKTQNQPYRAYKPGIGPYPEHEAIKLVAQHMQQHCKQYCQRRYRIEIDVPYPNARQKCDMCIGSNFASQAAQWDWAIEVKLLRFLGDNGKPNDNMLMHILSPYERHRSALTDCAKLAGSQLAMHKAILIYGFEHQEWPLEPAIQAFETLACARFHIGQRYEATFDDLVHTVHKEGKVFAWQVSP